LLSFVAVYLENANLKLHVKILCEMKLLTLFYMTNKLKITGPELYRLL